MTAGWILCLALVGQNPALANKSDGWQPGGSFAVAQSQYTTPHTNAQPNQNQFAQQPQTGAVDRFGRPIAYSHAQQQQGQSQPAQSAWPSNTSQFNNTQASQFAAGQQSGSAQGGSQFSSHSVAQQNSQAYQQGTVQGTAHGQQQTDPRFGYPQQSASAGQSPQNNWQQANGAGQMTAPALVPPQNAPQQNHSWPNQQQPGGSLQNQQQQHQNQQLHPSWTNGSQFANNGAGQQQAGTFGNPQVDASFGNGNSRFGAQVNLENGRITVADNTGGQFQQAPSNAGQQNHAQSGTGQSVLAPPPVYADRGAGGQTSEQFAAQPNSQFNNGQSSLSLQPPMGATLPTGSHQQADGGQPNVTPYSHVQPPRADQNAGQNQVLVSEPRWNDGRNAGTNADPGQQHAHGEHPANNNSQQNAPNVLSGLFAGKKSSDAQNQTSTFGQPNNRGAATNTSGGSGLFASAAVGRPVGTQGTGSQNSNPADEGNEAEYEPTFYLGFSLFANLFLIGGVLYLGWIAFESHFRYRRLLVEGDDYDDSRRGGRDEDRGSRRR